MINVDVSATAFYSAQTVIGFLNDVMERDKFADERRELLDRERANFSKEIKGKWKYPATDNICLSLFMN